jgi:hypothetical protein
MAFADLDRRTKSLQRKAKGNWQKLKGEANRKLADIEDSIDQAIDR